MKTLYIVRHAKSSWDDHSLDDFDRPLNERGKRDSPKMGKRLRDNKHFPDLMISSPAKRAFSTAKRIAEELGYQKKSILLEQKLYHAEPETFFSVLQHLHQDYEKVMLFGHNPGLTDFVNKLVDAREYIDNVPTCGIVAFKLSIDDWQLLKPSGGELLFFDYPKRTED